MVEGGRCRGVCRQIPSDDQGDAGQVMSFETKSGGDDLPESKSDGAEEGASDPMVWQRRETSVCSPWTTTRFASVRPSSSLLLCNLRPWSQLPALHLLLPVLPVVPDWLYIAGCL